MWGILRGRTYWGGALLRFGTARSTVKSNAVASATVCRVPQSWDNECADRSVPAQGDRVPGGYVAPEGCTPERAIAKGLPVVRTSRESNATCPISRQKAVQKRPVFARKCTKNGPNRSFPIHPFRLFAAKSTPRHRNGSRIRRRCGKLWLLSPRRRTFCRHQARN